MLEVSGQNPDLIPLERPSQSAALARTAILCWIYEETLLTLDDVRSRATAEYRKIPQNTLTTGD